MTPPYKSRHKAVCDQSITLFLTGFKINRFWKYHKWLMIHRLLKKVNQELESSHGIGFLGQEQWHGNPDISVQYWRSHEELLSFARNKQALHFPAWLKFNEYVALNGDVGLWHEIYVVEADKMEGLYRNMQPIGLGRFMGVDAVKGNRIETNNET